MTQRLLQPRSLPRHLLAGLVAGALCAAAGAHAQTPPAAAAPAAATAAAPAPSAAARPASVSSSVITVGNLVLIENALAARTAQKARVDAGLVAPEQPANRPSGPPSAPVVTADVLAVLGPAENLRAHLVVDGQPFDNVQAGSNVRGCVVERVTPRCVVFRQNPVAAASKAGAGAGAGPAAPVCPQACWTGIPRAPAMAAGGPGMPPLPPGAPGMPLPTPMPNMGIAPAMGAVPPAFAAAPPQAAPVTAPVAAAVAAPAAGTNAAPASNLAR